MSRRVVKARGGSVGAKKPLLSVLVRTWPGNEEGLIGLTETLKALRQKHEILPWAVADGPPACQAPWVWVLDVGDRPDSALIAAVGRAVTQEDPALWSMRRIYGFLGVPMRHGAWGPDERICLFPKEWAWLEPLGDDWILECVRPCPRPRRLGGISRDNRAPNLSTYLHRVNQDSSRRAEALLAREGACPGLALVRMFLFPPLAFLDGFLWSLGILDGEAGLNLALLEASAEFWTVAKWWHRSWKAKGGGPGVPWFLKGPARPDRSA
ncbi:MAG: hypothetical protein ACREKE_08375 [bacterium]